MIPASIIRLLPQDMLSRLALVACAASGSLLLAALAFEHVGGLRPCELCHWQRYAHVAVLLLGAGALLTRGQARAILFGMTIAALIGASGLALYHAGVEWKWWAGPQSCSGSLPKGLSLDELRRRLMGTPVVRCDVVPWSLAGLSMAGWNFLLSLAVTGLLAVGAWRAGARPA